MPLNYTPGRTISTNDTYTDPVTEVEYEVFHDTDAADPRDDIEPAQAALWAYQEPSLGSSTAADKPEGNIGIDVFASYWQRYGSRGNSDAGQRVLMLTQRHLNAFHPDHGLTLAIANIKGYSQSEWLDVVAATCTEAGTAQGFINTFRMWVFNDVWCVVPGDDHDALGNIYADSAEEAVAYFIADTQPSTKPADAVTVPWLTPDEATPAPDTADRGWQVAWEIDVEASTPEQAAYTAWVNHFEHPLSQPNPDDACVFTVGGREIDLSKSEYAHLFVKKAPGGFWEQIRQQLQVIETEKPDTFNTVRAILLDQAYEEITDYVNANGTRIFDANSAFFAGSGGDATLREALFKAGWQTSCIIADPYFYVMTHPATDEILTYIEGDVIRGDRRLN